MKKRGFFEKVSALYSSIAEKYRALNASGKLASVKQLVTGVLAKLGGAKKEAEGHAAGKLSGTAAKQEHGKHSIFELAKEKFSHLFH